MRDGFVFHAEDVASASDAACYCCAEPIQVNDLVVRLKVWGGTNDGLVVVVHRWCWFKR